MDNTVFEKLKNSLCEFIRIPSVRGEAVDGAPCGAECNRALDYALNLGLSLGFQKAKNLDGLVGYLDVGKGEECFGILGHVDVVPEGDGWTKEPFGGQVVGDRIYGRGAMDDKGPIVIIMYAIHKLLQEGLVPKKRIRLILGADEETGGNPTVTSWESMDRYLLSEKMPDIGISPDADFPVINAEKGIMNVRLSTKSPHSILYAQGGTATNIVPNYAEVVVTPEHFVKVEGLTIDKSDTGIKISAKGRSAHGAKPYDGDNAIVKLLTTLFPENEQFSALADVYGKGLGDPLAEGVPLGELVGAARVIDIDEVFVVECNGTHLVIGGRQHLDHIVPALAILFVLKELLSFALEIINDSIEHIETALVKTVVGEVVARELFCVDLVHGRGRIGNRSYLVGVKLLPPIEGRGNIDRNEHLTQEFAVVAACNRQAVPKIEVGGTDDKLTVLIVGAIGFCPTVHRVAGATDGVVDIHHRCAFHFEHCTVLHLGFLYQVYHISLRMSILFSFLILKKMFKFF